MSGRFGETPFTVSSRYTHVFVKEQSQWRIVSAQGTQIVN
jgi:ketosteroid isomerase-like protein